MRNLLILTLLAGATIGFHASSEAIYAQEPEASGASMETKLELSVLPSKRQYKLNEQFKMLVLLRNAGTKDVYVLGTLEWGRLASFLFHIYDASGKEIRPRAVPDDQTLVLRDDKSAFVKLLPKHFLGTDFYSQMDLLGLDKPGKYSIVV